MGRKTLVALKVTPAERTYLRSLERERGESASALIRHALRQVYVEGADEKT